MNDIKLDLAYASSRGATFWKNERINWSDMVRKCSTTHVTHETFAEYCAGTPDYRSNIKDVGGYVTGYLNGGSRSKDAVLYKQIVALEVDYAEAGLLDRVKSLPVAWLWHTTHSHSPEKPRYRILIPLDKPADPAQYQPVARMIAKFIGIESVDRTSYDVNRIMYWPSTSKDGVFESGYNDGPIASTDQILASYTNWQDASSWPMSVAELDMIRTGVGELGDPASKPGVVGAFCRVFSVTDAIDRFLGDRYEAGVNPDRYTYKYGSTVNGLVVYEDQHAYSHHSTDPVSVSGHPVNAFDLVRLHLFGEKEDNKTQPMGKRKSFIDMSDFARTIPQVKELLLSERFSAAEEFTAYSGTSQPTPVQDPDAPKYHPADPTGSGWRGKLLDLDKQHKALSSLKNIRIVMQHDARIKDCFAFDKFANRLVLKKNPVWRAGADVDEFRDTDDSYLREFMESEYGISGKEKIIDALSITADKSAFHPVREYLNSVSWDGVNRIESLFNAFLGVEDSEYTRQVSRKWFTGAVARIFKPGIKFDNMLIFVGAEGIGKSTLINKLGGEWFSDTAIDLKNKVQSMEDLQGVWIMEWAELTSFRTASVEAVKSFVGKQIDRFRVAYGRRVESFARQCIFMGTTNVMDFLNDPDGSRRFWPLLTQVVPITADVHEQFTEELRAQIWAEAVHLFKSGEKLNLSKELVAIAKAVQQAHTETDDRITLIKSFMDRRIPANWYQMEEAERFTWNLNYKEGEAGSGLILRPKICATEIWIEALGGTRLTMTKTNTRFIHNYLRNNHEWEAYSTTTGFGPYGQQKGYSRKIV